MVDDDMASLKNGIGAVQKYLITKELQESISKNLQVGSSEK